MSESHTDLTESQLRTSTGAKWNHYGKDVLPLWVADMDFRIAGPIRQAIRDYADGDNFGYPLGSGIPGLIEAVTDHLLKRHGVAYLPEHVYPTSGIIPGLFLGVQALAGPGDQAVIQPPVYPPFAMAVENTGRRVLENPMAERDGNWELDLEQLEQAITPATRLLILCNPQNPTGRVFSASELEALGEVVLRHNLWVISDELHCDLVLHGKHVPFASLSDELAQRTITLFGPTKTFNIAGLKIGFALSHNEQLLGRLKEQAAGVLTPPNVLAQAAARAAFTECGQWHEQTLEQLRANCRLLSELVEEKLPGVRYRPAEGTYLAWLDFREVFDPEKLDAFLLEEAKVAVNPGVSFGTGGAGFVRMNLATSENIIREAVSRISTALAAR